MTLGYFSIFSFSLEYYKMGLVKAFGLFKCQLPVATILYRIGNGHDNERNKLLMFDYGCQLLRGIFILLTWI